MKKIIVERLQNGLINPDYAKHLQNPVGKSELNQLESSVLEKTLFAALEAYGGTGLSANQLGLDKRACVVKAKDKQLFLLNPVIKQRSDSAFLYREGCLSLPKTIKNPIRTVRAMKVVVETDNLGELTFEADEQLVTTGKPSYEGADVDTLMTVVVQHEIDHLDGITIRERIYTTTAHNKQTYRRNDKVVMKSPKGELIEVKYKKANDYYLIGYEVV